MKRQERRSEGRQRREEGREREGERGRKAQRERERKTDRDRARNREADKGRCDKEKSTCMPLNETSKFTLVFSAFTATPYSGNLCVVHARVWGVKATGEKRQTKTEQKKQ